MSNWSDLPVSGDVLRKWIINGIKQVFNNSSRAPKNQLQKLDESEEEVVEPGSTESNE